MGNAHSSVCESASFCEHLFAPSEWRPQRQPPLDYTMEWFFTPSRNLGGRIRPVWGGGAPPFRVLLRILPGRLSLKRSLPETDAGPLMSRHSGGMSRHAASLGRPSAVIREDRPTPKARFEGPPLVPRRDCSGKCSEVSSRFNKPQ